MQQTPQYDVIVGGGETRAGRRVNASTRDWIADVRAARLRDDSSDRAAMRGMPAALAIFTAIALTTLTAVSAFAQSYPAKPIRLISPFAAGGGADTVARYFGQKLSAPLQQQVIVDNRPGAGSIIGTEAAAKATPDGYTLLIVNDTHAINASLHKKLPYDPIKDFAPITLDRGDAVHAERASVAARQVRSGPRPARQRADREKSSTPRPETAPFRILPASC